MVSKHVDSVIWPCSNHLLLFEWWHYDGFIIFCQLPSARFQTSRPIRVSSGSRRKCRCAHITKPPSTSTAKTRNSFTTPTSTLSTDAGRVDPSSKWRSPPSSMTHSLRKTRTSYNFSRNTLRTRSQTVESGTTRRKMNTHKQVTSPFFFLIGVKIKYMTVLKRCFLQFLTASKTTVPVSSRASLLSIFSLLQT